LQGATESAMIAFATSIKNADNYFPPYFMLATDYYQHKSLTQTKTYLTKARIEFPNSAYLLFLSGVADYNLHNDVVAKQEIAQAYAKSKYAGLLDIYQHMEEKKDITSEVTVVFQQIFTHQ